MTGSLVIPGFGGGVVKASSAEAMQTNELAEADGCDIAEREQLVSASLPAFYTEEQDELNVALVRIMGLYGRTVANAAQSVVVGKGKDAGGVDRYIIFLASPIDEANPVNPVPNRHVLGGVVAEERTIATFASFPYVLAGFQIQPLLICIGARFPLSPSNSCELLVLQYQGAGFYTIRLASYYDALGTGPGGEFIGGTKSKVLRPRGICAWNNFIFAWGFDFSETSLGGDGPARLMFSNVANPLKWGNDDQAASGVDRDFSDTDAISIGGAGERITCCLGSGGKLWIGTDRGLHYLAGSGRDTFKTDGTTGIARALDVVGPNGMIEGTDSILYGCSTRGLWAYNGQVNHLGAKLIDPRGHSNGFWDLIWFDSTHAGSTPGVTNRDLVWMMIEREKNAVWVVIPYCDSVAGFGYGTDTVVIKYNVNTGGFTRQVFVSQTFTAGMEIPAGSYSPDTVVLANAPLGLTSAPGLYRYRYRATPNAIAVSAPMSLTFGEYAPYGPNGVGECRVAYFTIAWESDIVASPVIATLFLFVDGQQVDTFVLTMGGAAAPVAPAAGDIWLDTLGTDVNLGNASAGAFTPATNDYILRRWVASWNKWVPIPRAQGMKGTRATIPIAYVATPGTRVKIRATFNANQRISVESLGIGPTALRTTE